MSYTLISYLFHTYICIEALFTHTKQQTRLNTEISHLNLELNPLDCKKYICYAFKSTKWHQLTKSEESFMRFSCITESRSWSTSPEIPTSWVTGLLLRPWYLSQDTVSTVQLSVLATRYTSSKTESSRTGCYVGKGYREFQVLHWWVSKQTLSEKFTTHKV